MQISPITAPQVPKDFHLNLRKRFFTQLSSQVNEPEFKSSICLFKGIEPLPKNHEDTDHLVIQESTFWYLFGVKETGCYAVIHNESGKTTLFVPRLDEAYKLWMHVKEREQFVKDYGVEEVRYVDELKQCIQEIKPQKVYLYSGMNTDSKISVGLPESTYYSNFATEQQTLFPLISNLRAIKTQAELDIIRYVCKLTTQAHLLAMRSAKPGLIQRQLHTVFHFHHSIKSGSLELGFDSICSSGQDCATLHYIQNQKTIQEGQLLLHDMGGKWYGYVADQAISFPVDGKFTQKQKEVYNAVYQAQKAVLQVLKAGVEWTDMHLLAERVILQHLIKMGVVNDFPIEELVEKRIGAVFFPHGLGHFFGLMVHDLGGYTKGPARSDQSGLKSLRTRRQLEANMCITVEPGLYFIDFMIEKTLADPQLGIYLNRQRIDFYKEIGGVRLEDDVLIKEDGIEMLSFLPRTIEEVEAALQSK